MDDRFLKACGVLGEDAERDGMAETLAAACARLMEVSESARDPRLDALLARMRDLGAALAAEEPPARLTLRRS